MKKWKRQKDEIKEKKKTAKMSEDCAQNKNMGFTLLVLINEQNIRKRVQAIGQPRANFVSVSSSGN